MKIYDPEQIKFIGIDINIRNNMRKKTVYVSKYDALVFVIKVIKNMI